MKFQEGDKVAVLDDAINGIVKNVSSNEIQIETTDGFLMLFNSNELVKIKEEQSEISKKVLVPEHLGYKVDSSKKRQGIKFKSKKEGVPPMEVDLHLEKLVKNSRGMDNYDKLSLQIDTATHKLEFAIRNRIPRIVFIHGVGEGVLKQELNFLFNRYNVSVSEASYQKYGMGATEVYILQNANN